LPPRFYCSTLPELTLPDAVCTLDPDESRHARKVLRLSEGDRVELFDGSGRLAHAVIVDKALKVPGVVGCRVESIETPPRVTPWLTVASAVPKGPRSAEMVNQLAQAGVDRFVPLTTARSVVDPNENQRQRFERAALAAAKQSGRLTRMQIGGARRWEDLPTDGGLTLMLDRAGQGGAAVDDAIRGAERVTLMVGPEGGWDEAERAGAEAAGVRRWRLGPSVLRIETAAVAGAAVVRYLRSGDATD
jgi:16S rRNA (uracil1498-N3)-methyltransferase